jgi:phosphatidylglycerol:prolipoprotein diacylglycerol transferase
MILFWYQHLTQYIDPIAFTIGSFSIRWYAISYIIGFSVVYGLLRWRIKNGEWPGGISNFEFRISNKNPIVNCQLSIVLQDFILVAFFSALFGGRIGYVLFYNLPYFWTHPMAIISPYVDGYFTGIYGMSYHGALFGIVLGSVIFLHIKKINFWQWADFVVPAVPFGYFFGRIGNFLNGELYGRVTNSSWGMYFSSDRISLRHPSQLYEALLEGILLFSILWIIRNKKLPSGLLFLAYLVGYGIARVVSEFFREPDLQIGFFWGYLTLGQVLSLAMIFLGMGIFSVSKNKKDGILIEKN